MDDRRAEQPLRTRARVTTVVGLGEDVSQVTAAVRVEVVQGLAREITLAVPDGLVVNQVEGATIGDWSVAGGLLRVRLLDPTSTEASFVVQGETRAPREGPVVVPLVRMPSAERETGGVAVDVVGAGEIAERQVRGLEPADPSELGEPVSGRESPSMIAFRLRPLAGSEPRALTVTVVRYTPQAVLIANVEEARYRALASEDGLRARRGALRRAQQPAQLPQGVDAAGRHALERQGRRPADSAGRRGAGRGAAAAREGPRGRRGADVRARADVSAARERRGPTRASRGWRCPRSTCRSRAPASRCTTRRDSRWTCSPGRSGSKTTSVRSPRRCARRRAAAPCRSQGRDACRTTAPSAGLQALVDRFQNESGGRRVVGRAAGQRDVSRSSAVRSSSRRSCSPRARLRRWNWLSSARSEGASPLGMV